MEETYCGKSCAQCAYKDELSCPGCKSAHEGTPDCAIARCCRSSRRESCQDCFASGSCAALAASENMPQARICQQEQQAIAKDRAQPLEKLFWILFWIGAADFSYGFIGDLLSRTSSWQVVLFSMIFELVVALICLVAKPVIYWKLRSFDDRYKKAAILYVVCGLLVSAILFLKEAPFAAALFLIAAVSVEIFCIYLVLNAHASTVSPEDGSLESKWLFLRKLYMGYFCLCGIFILSLIVLYPVPTGMTSFGRSAAGFLQSILTILELVYLYQTAKAFKFCAYS